MQLYRADKRNVEVGETIETAGHYLAKFPPETQLLENRFEDFRPEAKPRRTDCLFLFESLDAAKRHWSIMRGGRLYKVEVPDEAVLHRGDMRWLDVIAEQTRAGEDPEDSYRRYWAGETTESPIIEIMVTSAVVIEVISKDDGERLAFLKERWGFR